jgi:hypothetical protein
MAISKHPATDQVRPCLPGGGISLVTLSLTGQVRIKKLSDMCHQTEAETVEVLESAAQREGVSDRAVHQGACENKPGTMS